MRSSAELEGVGVCLIDVPRFERALERFGERLLARVFVAPEIDYARQASAPAQPLAARLAAKIAVRRALRMARLEVPPLRKLEIARGAHGEPRIDWQLRDGPNPHLSMSHDPTWAVASVWLERAPE